jgi:hypothetical protein
LGNGLDELSVYALNTYVPFGAFAALDSGVYRTDTLNNNGNWQPKNTGLSNAVVTCLAVAKDAAHTVYAGTAGAGIFKITDRGASWNIFNTPNHSGQTSMAIAIDPTNSNLYLGLANEGWQTSDVGQTWTLANGGVLKSSNSGQTWNDLGLTQCRGVNAVALDPASKSIYCGLQNAGVAASNPAPKSGLASLMLLLED